MSMNARTEDGVLLVSQVRAKRHPVALVGGLLGGIGGYFLVAWLVMLLLPYAFGPEFAWGYWRVLAVICVIRLVIGPKGSPVPAMSEVK